MECTQGFAGAEEDDILTLNECIYGLLQMARQNREKAVKHKKGVVFVAIYVKDNLIVGYSDAIKDTIKQLKKNRFIIICPVKFNSIPKKAWLGQPHYLINLERKFGKDIKYLRKT
ncbi:hypothetical protein ACHAXS_000132 [Conticribra weissflogii]